MNMNIDVLVLGAGVVGIANARALQLAGNDVVLVDAEPRFGMHTSSRNSEVIHAGVYYPPGSLKARLCVRGKELLYAYCAARAVPHKRLGKLIVATQASEEDILNSYVAKAKANGVDDLHPVSRDELARLEPEVHGTAAIFSPSTGIVDSHGFMAAMLDDFENAGGIFARKTRIERAVAEASGFTIILDDGECFSVRRLVNSAGLEAPVFAGRIEGLAMEHVPERRFAIGHYYGLGRRSPFHHLVYPVAVQGALGVHVTLDMTGAARFGPDIRWLDEVNYVFDDSRRGEFLEAIARYFPAICTDDLVPAYTGVRPKIIVDGKVAEDFVISGPAQHGLPGLVNLFGIESPGLTSALAIAEQVQTLL
jgi:L-2-hydroxyglutarate oxidase LhgO